MKSFIIPFIIMAQVAQAEPKDLGVVQDILLRSSQTAFRCAVTTTKDYMAIFSDVCPGFNLGDRIVLERHDNAPVLCVDAEPTKCAFPVIFIEGYSGTSFSKSKHMQM